MVNACSSNQGMRNVYSLLEGNPLAKVSLGVKRSWINNIQVNQKEISFEVVSWMKCNRGKLRHFDVHTSDSVIRVSSLDNDYFLTLSALTVVMITMYFSSFLTPS